MKLSTANGGVISRQVMRFEEWIDLGRTIYGDDLANWKFRCIWCGHVQGYGQLLLDYPHLSKQEAASRLVSVCGIVQEGDGCGQVLGGELLLHKREIDMGDGSPNVPVFLFADEEKVPA